MDHNPSGAQPAAGNDSQSTEISDTDILASHDLSPQAQSIIQVLLDRKQDLPLTLEDPRAQFQHYHEFSLKPTDFNALTSSEQLYDLLLEYTWAYNYFPSLECFTVLLYFHGYIYFEAAAHLAITASDRLQDALNVAASQSAIPAHFIDAKILNLGEQLERYFEKDGVQTKSVVNAHGGVSCRLPSVKEWVPLCWIQVGWSHPADIDKFKAAMIERRGQPRITIFVTLAYNGPVPSTKDAISLDILQAWVKRGVPVVRHDVRGVDVRSQDPSATIGLYLSDFEEDLPRQPVDLRYGDIVDAVEENISFHQDLFRL
ncbi:hypothetical protein PG984_015771 [Apiospora sp. TS-2023a]